MKKIDIVEENYLAITKLKSRGVSYKTIYEKCEISVFMSYKLFNKYINVVKNRKEKQGKSNG